MTARDHNKLLSILFLVYGLMQIFGLVIITLFVASFGAYAIQNIDFHASGMFLVIMTASIIIAAVISVVPPLLAAFGLFKRKGWSRVVGAVAGIFALLSIPLGTVLGVYALWFLFSEDAKQFYLTGEGGSGHLPPPPPQNWQ